MQTINTEIPVVILNSGLYDGLGILRSLGKLGVELFLIIPSHNLPAAESKYCSGKFIWNIDEASPEDTLKFLQNVSLNFIQKPVLMYTSDKVMLFVQSNSDSLKDWFVFPHPGIDLIWKLYSKKEMYLLAREHRIPTPESYFPQTKDELAEIAEHIQFPVLLKGIDGVLMDKRNGRKMMANNSEELLRNYSSIEDPVKPNVIVQEYIPRDNNAYWIFDGYFNSKSECLASFTGRKFRQYPPHFGMTSYGITQWNKTLAELAKHFLCSVGYWGVVGMDYLYDIRDNQYKVVDINMRIAANFRLFVGSSGIDVAQAQYLDLTGQQVPKSKCKDGRKWLAEDKDLLASYHYFREGKLTLWSWLRSQTGVHERGYFDFHDTLPFWRMLLNYSKRFLLKPFNGLNRKTTQQTILPHRTNNSFFSSLQNKFDDLLKRNFNSRKKATTSGNNGMDSIFKQGPVFTLKQWFSEKRNMVLAFLLAGIIVLSGVIVISEVTGTTLRDLTIDPADIDYTPVYLGMLTYFGLMLWASSASFCFFGANLIRKNPGAGFFNFLFASGLICILYLFDDAFLLHERVFPYTFGIPETIVYLLYTGIMLFYLFYFFNEIMQTDFPLFLLAGSFLGLSIIMDMIFPITSIETFIEDGLKFLGIIFWTAYYARTSNFIVSRKGYNLNKINYLSFEKAAQERRYK